MLDFTGELGRLAIAQATRRDEAAVQRARDLVEAIMGQFLQASPGVGVVGWEWGALLPGRVRPGGRV